MTDYPRVSNRWRVHGRGPCAVCGGSGGADILVTIQVSEMRGDDEVYLAHRQCIHGRKSADLIEIFRQHPRAHPPNGMYWEDR